MRLILCNCIDLYNIIKEVVDCASNTGIANFLFTTNPILFCANNSSRKVR